MTRKVDALGLLQLVAMIGFPSVGYYATLSALNIPHPDFWLSPLAACWIGGLVYVRFHRLAGRKETYGGMLVFSEAWILLVALWGFQVLGSEALSRFAVNAILTPIILVTVYRLRFLADYLVLPDAKPAPTEAASRNLADLGGPESGDKAAADISQRLRT